MKNVRYGVQVETSKCFEITYTGASLQDMRLRVVGWRVKLWDENGKQVQS